MIRNSSSQQFSFHYKKKVNSFCSISVHWNVFLNEIIAEWKDIKKHVTCLRAFFFFFMKRDCWFKRNCEVHTLCFCAWVILKSQGIIKLNIPKASLHYKCLWSRVNWPLNMSSHFSEIKFARFILVKSIICD